jgi:hypothetical protein
MQFGIQLRKILVSLKQITISFRLTSTQSSSSTFPLASTLTCFSVSRATSYDCPVDWIACRTADLSTLPGVSVRNELRIRLRNLESTSLRVVNLRT